MRPNSTIRSIGHRALLAGVVLASGNAMAASSVNFSLQASGGSWAAYATVNDPASLGLAGIQFDVAGQGVQLGAPLATDNRLVTGGFHDGGGALVGSGFIDFRGAVFNNNDIQFQGAQPAVYDNEDPLGNDDLASGFGLPGVNAGMVGDQPASWGSPALIATGTYTGSGFIAVFSSTNLITLLPKTLPADQGVIQTHSPTAISGQSVSVPEPSCLAVAVAGAASLLSRRRRL
ncbi:MAG TPA: hypothetical protein VG269_24690 [Tepidisphaeraceae bacterium]|nr:hypothetical protein [Tepidisphaeraceae bacterium]